MTSDGSPETPEHRRVREGMESLLEQNAAEMNALDTETAYTLGNLTERKVVLKERRKELEHLYTLGGFGEPPAFEPTVGVRQRSA